jgi:hypothetical protein
MPENRAFVEGFFTELAKLGFVKEAFIPLIPAAIAALAVGGGSLGLGAMMKPKDMTWRKWMPPGTTMKTMGHMLGLAGMVTGGTGAAGLGLKGMSAAGVMGDMKTPKPTLAWQPKSIAATPLGRQHDEMAGGF